MLVAFLFIPSQQLHVQSWQLRCWRDVWGGFEVDSEDIKTTPVVSCSGVFIVNFGCISYLVQVSMLIGFEQLIADWVSNLIIVFMYVYLMKNKKLQMERKTKNNVLCECICLYSYFSEIKKYVIIAIM